ncbi:hypothetical protein [Zhihengliuella flava]|uniref:Tetratricopeptide (TPR) repeat protein n=1 Tax=Zhihengliuella flava TaxID=1285193 RepID=A0A931DBK3_9MICC|nr:hypothetical protein [Zhihengliuella flava]MBG6083730.1 tetratricopeptide (TPR) repeat protein [Zhihengliuella flava]
MAEERRDSGKDRHNNARRHGDSGRPSFGGDKARGGPRRDRGGSAAGGRTDGDRRRSGRDGNNDWSKDGGPRGGKRHGEKKPYGQKKFDDRQPRTGRDAQRSARPTGQRRDQDGAPNLNRGDLRSSNRPDRQRSPDIDDDVTGKELDRAARAELRYLQDPNGTWVSKHLVMAGRLIDVDPELAYQHALAASRRGGRIAVVREAVGLTAYAAGHFADALREFRTYRRISGSNVHLPMMVDSERGLGRPEKALELAAAEEAAELDTPVRVELAIVVSGAHADLGHFEAALQALEIPQLDRNRAYSFSPRLFAVYAEALEDLGRSDEAQQWRDRVAVAEEALGVGAFAEPDIVDFGDDEPQERKPRAKDVVPAPAGPSDAAPAAEQGIDAEDGLQVVDSTDDAHAAPTEPAEETAERAAEDR